jgi:hypothetical protein
MTALGLKQASAKFSLMSPLAALADHQPRQSTGPVLLQERNSVETTNLSGWGHKLPYRGDCEFPGPTPHKEHDNPSGSDLIVQKYCGHTI